MEMNPPEERVAAYAKQARRIEAGASYNKGVALLPGVELDEVQDLATEFSPLYNRTVSSTGVRRSILELKLAHVAKKLTSRARLELAGDRELIEAEIELGNVANPNPTRRWERIVLANAISGAVRGDRVGKLEPAEPRTAILVSAGPPILFD